MVVEKLLLLVCAPLAALIIILGWIVLYSKGRRSVHLQLKGLGLQIELRTSNTENIHVRNEPLAG